MRRLAAPSSSTTKTTACVEREAAVAETREGNPGMPGRRQRRVPVREMLVGEAMAGARRLDVAAVQAYATSIIGNVERVIVGKRDVVELTVVALLCEGH